MENILPIHLQEIIYSSSDTQISKQISILVRTGKLRKIASRLYTPNFSETDENIIKRNLFDILGKLYPNAVLSHRSALEFQPTTLGHIFLSYSYTKKINLPGITVRLIEGYGPIDGDNPLSGKLFASSLERALLENLEVSRQQGPESKTVNQEVLEERLEQVIRVKGEAGLNKIRDKARIIAEQLNLKREFSKLDMLISAMLSTQPSKALKSPIAVARAFGYPFDPFRIELFEKLFIECKQSEFKDLPDINFSVQAFRNFAFFEAYFSNYIEGTEFELDDAKLIIQTEKAMKTRYEDSHDILGTYKLVSSREEMERTPSNPDELIEILLYRHSVLLGGRSSKNPGQFKDKNNRAGETYFVDHSLAKGTLIKAFDFYQALTHPFAKAAYIMFLVSEVHPFLDGNGRIARVMMNAEFVKQGQSKIIIPTVFRDDYMGSLRRLSRQQDPVVYIKMLIRIHEFSASLHGEDLDLMEKRLIVANAFKEHHTAKLKIID